MRGFGVTIADFALEVQMDKLARLIGMICLNFVRERLSRRRYQGAPSGDRRRRSHRSHAGSLPGRKLACSRKILRDVVVQEGGLTMAILHGRGVAAINYPTGMNLGGDPTQALVHSTPTGNFVVTLSSVDLGQGMRQIMAQICAETIGVPTERIIVDTADTDTGPHCMGTFASRGTHRAGNAVIQAAKEARQVMLEVAAEELEVNAGDLETDGVGNINIKGAPQRSISIFDTALAAHFKQGRSISGRGIFLVPRSYPDKATGAMKPATCYAHATGRRCRGRR